MFRRFLSFLCLLALAFQVVALAGCGGSTAASTGGSGGGTGGGTGGGGGGGIGGTNSSICGAAGFGYNDQNTQITGVWMQSPLPGQNPANVQVTATAYGPATVTQWTVCLDGEVASQSNTPGSSLSQAVTIPSGQHLLYALAADAQGHSNRSEIALIQVGTLAASSTVLPTPPATATVLSEMQNESTWGVCSLCAAGTNSTGNYWMQAGQSQPSLSGSSLEMYADGPSWTNVLFMDPMYGTNADTHFLWDFWVYHDPTAEPHFWSSEFDFWLALGGQEFMVGSQCDFGDGYWATWDSEGGSWILNGIPCPHWTPGWHHVQWYIERISSTQYRYDTLVFDGTGYGFNQAWTANTTTWPDMTGIQFQLDMDPTGTPLHEWVDNATLTMW